MKEHTEGPLAFAKLGIKGPFLKALVKLGFTAPTEIQAAMIEPAIQGRDVVGQARTGTGKTLAFALPTLQGMDPDTPIQAICLVPTRELAIQVVGEIKRLALFTRLKVVAVYGGQSVHHQMQQLRMGPQFVVGTPGRTMDFMNRGELDISHVKVAILDEVDRMLDIGFREDIRKILRHIKGKHQTMFTSATIDGNVRRLIQQFTSVPVEINVSHDEITVDEVDQYYISAERRDKFRLLKLLLKRDCPNRAIIFTNTKVQANRLRTKLCGAGFTAIEIHSDLAQRRREQAMDKFRHGEAKLLVATDLASRGIDVDGITHIINYDIPDDTEVYVHRIGRTARMGNSGTAITFVTREEGKQITAVEMLINKEVPERILKGFKPSPPEEKPQPTEAKRTKSRYQLPVSGGDGQAPTSAPPQKTLGSRFRPSRRRRI